MAKAYVKLQILKAIEKTDLSRPMDWFLEAIWEEPLSEEYYPTTAAPMVFDFDFGDLSDVDWYEDYDYERRRRRREAVEGPCKAWACLGSSNYSKADIRDKFLSSKVHSIHICFIIFGYRCLYFHPVVYNMSMFACNVKQ